MSKGERKEREMSLRNKKDFREAVLQALDVTDDKDVENEYNFKSAVLEAMGVEFVPADLRDFEIYRAKLVEGIGNMSSGGGGGGSSDFSTAEVTVICNIEDGTTFEGPLIKNDNLQNSQHINNGSNTVTCVLYKGVNYSGTYDIDMSTAVITGNAEYSSEDDCYIITGDCTITIS